jgi:hypothetical protein
VSGAGMPPAVPACLRFIGIAGGIRAGGREQAWHYAIDAYASIPVTVGVWWAAGPFFRWWSETGIPAAGNRGAGTP